MFGPWVSLSAQWKLEDVQAITSVVVTALSGAAAYVFVRCCWQHAVQNVTKGNDVPLYSLLSISTIGEVLDVVTLLRGRLVCRRYTILSIQIFVILLFSATAAFSGPIARFTTKIDTIVVIQNVSGSLASRSLGGVVSAPIEWTDTYNRLQLADFPMNQLADYLPDNNVDWTFEPSQWNNSWSLTCQKTPETNITIRGTGNCNNSLALYELSGFDTIYNASNYDYTSWLDRTIVLGDNGTDQDTGIFFFAHKERDPQADQQIYHSESFTVMLIHLHQFPKRPDGQPKCHFGNGTAKSSSYSKIECQVRYQAVHAQDHVNIAYPDQPSDNDLLTGYINFYWPKLAVQSVARLPFQLPSPEDLIRFYQTYTITKDVQFVQPVSRLLNVKQPVVQLSIIFLVSMLLVTILVTCCLVNYLVFLIRHRNAVSNTPDTKLDWVMQSIEVEDRPLAGSGDGNKLRRSVTSTAVSESIGLSRDKRRKLEFEAAVYGAQETTTWFLGRPKSSDSNISISLMTTTGNNVSQTVRSSQASTLNDSVRKPRGFHETV